MELWPHQQRAVSETLAAIGRGERRVCVTSPTGGGKTKIATELAKHYLARRKKVVIYTNRRLLLEQTSRVLAEADLFHGVRASGHEDDREHPFQVSSIQTEHSRVTRKGVWHLHEADLVLVDEAHAQKSEQVGEILAAHWQAGAACVGLTATPIGLGHLYDTLVVAGTTSELRACGALVPAVHFGPDEPDLRRLKGLREGEDLSESQNRQAVMRPGIWGRVWEWFEKLNPEHRPSILFAPGVGESIWFAERFTAAGVSAAHIDGEDVWLNGKLYRTSRQLRQEVLDGSREGRIVVLCNRFVLREGIDAPWLAHGILATVFGSLQSYLQSGGRLLRAYRGLDHVTIADHGGNWHRHGSLNADRQWRLEFTAAMVAGLRAERLRAKAEPEPWRCPRCGRIWGGGIKCSPARGGCGYELQPHKKSRPVVSTDGKLVELAGDIFRPHRVYGVCSCGGNPDCPVCHGSGVSKPNGPAIWERMYNRARSRKWNATFRQAMALFAAENGWGYPDPSWPFMPTRDLDLWRKVSDVPIERLVQPAVREAAGAEPG